MVRLSTNQTGPGGSCIVIPSLLLVLFAYLLFFFIAALVVARCLSMGRSCSEYPSLFLFFFHGASGRAGCVTARCQLLLRCWLCSIIGAGIATATTLSIHAVRFFVHRLLLVSAVVASGG
jgi:hypothetical protein